MTDDPANAFYLVARRMNRTLTYNQLRERRKALWGIDIPEVTMTEPEPVSDDTEPHFYIYTWKDGVGQDHHFNVLVLPSHDEGTPEVRAIGGADTFIRWGDDITMQEVMLFILVLASVNQYVSPLDIKKVSENLPPAVRNGIYDEAELDGILLFIEALFSIQLILTDRVTDELDNLSLEKQDLDTQIVPSHTVPSLIKQPIEHPSGEKRTLYDFVVPTERPMEIRGDAHDEKLVLSTMEFSESDDESAAEDLGFDTTDVDWSTF